MSSPLLDFWGVNCHSSTGTRLSHASRVMENTASEDQKKGASRSSSPDRELELDCPGVPGTKGHTGGRPGDTGSKPVVPGTSPVVPRPRPGDPGTMVGAITCKTSFGVRGPILGSGMQDPRIQMQVLRPPEPGVPGTVFGVRGPILGASRSGPGVPGTGLEIQSSS